MKIKGLEYAIFNTYQYRLSEKFKVLQIQSYDGTGDPVKHIENFWVHLNLHSTPDEVACRAFPLTLTGNAQDWFRRLPLGSIDLFEGQPEHTRNPQGTCSHCNKRVKRLLNILWPASTWKRWRWRI
jgi:hypothetical protein